MHSTKTFRTVCSTDPAIDLHHSNLDKFVLTRDLAHLTYVPGRVPVFYELRRPPSRIVVSYIDVAPEENLRHMRAFMTSVVGWMNLAGDDGVQRAVQGEPDWYHKDPTKLDGMMTWDEVALFHPEDITEIGAVAYQRCFLRPGRELVYTAPRTSVDALQRVLSHHVAVRAASSLSNVGPGEPPVPTPNATGAEATDVTARAKNGPADANVTPP
jgi:hypothetical protein